MFEAPTCLMAYSRFREDLVGAIGVVGLGRYGDSPRLRSLKLGPPRGSPLHEANLDQVISLCMLNLDPVKTF